MNEKYMENLKKQLLDGEQILWMGKPEKINLVEGPYKSSFIGRIIVCSVIACILPFLYCSSVGEKGSISIPVLIALIIVPLIAIIIPVLEKNKLETKCNCVITNKRAISFCDDPAFSSILKVVDLKNVNSIDVEILSTGKGIIYVGEKETNSKRTRLSAINGIQDKQGLTSGLVFYSINDPYKVCDNFPKNIRRAF
ncbi:MAG: hypothetical protein VB120_07715 [Lachnospiraceae bacterium]|nr:hypothetical protein [Lachnospiraceae bacterium]